jgi:pimeloyl-ACP methyl ester carboxylesterase
VADSSMRKVQSNDGTTIGYLRRGSGLPLLLVHGAMADHRRWLPVLPYFEQHFTVYAMDRRGRGLSGDATGYELGREAGDVAAVVEAIGEPAYVLGHSFGGLCSLEAALLTDKIDRLILYEPPIPGIAPPVPPGFPERMQALIDRGEPEAALVLFLREVVRMPEHELGPYRQSPMWEARIAIASTVPRELQVDRTYTLNPGRYAGLEVPTMLLLGGDSPPGAREAVAIVDAALPRSQVVVLPGQQHIAMDTAPELFAREVVQFLLESTWGA